MGRSSLSHVVASGGRQLPGGSQVNTNELAVVGHGLWGKVEGEGKQSSRATRG